MVVSDSAQRFFKILCVTLLGVLTFHATQAARFARSESRIVDGVNVTPVNKYPMMVAVIQRGDFVCSGTILNKYYILTISDCAGFFNPDGPSDLFVLAGIYHVGDPDPRYVQNISVKSVTLHASARDRSKGYQSYNIGVIRLSRPLVWNDYVVPTNLPEPGWNVLPGNEINAIAVGWGYGRNGTYPYAPTRPLQEIVLPLLTTEDCQRILSKQDLPCTDNQICLNPVGGAGPCFEDQGGPSFIYNEANDKHIQIGMFANSWKECESGNVNPPPAYSTKLSKFIHWIDEAIRECNPPRVI